jgi:hypothetical protein
MDVEATETVQVVGSLCTPLDLLGDRVTVPPCDVDDLVVIFQAGAYGRTASPTAFLEPSRARGGTRMSQTVTEVAGILASVLGIEDAGTVRLTCGHPCSGAPS